VKTGRIATCSLLLVALAGARGMAAPSRFEGKGTIAADKVPSQLEGIEIQEKPGSEIPRQLTFQDHTGATVSLGSFFTEGKPVILILGYYKCPNLCSLVLNGALNGLKDLAWVAGNEFRVVTVSFDPKDTVSIAAEKRAAYRTAYGRDLADKGAWDFLIGDEASVRTLADSVGFPYRWDAQANQYAHAAGIFLLTPDGRLSRTLYGFTYKERDLRLGLIEASEGKLGSTWDKVLLTCYSYSKHKGYTLATKAVMRIAGAVTLVVLGFFLFSMWRRERRRRDEGTS
jgi:protein SCO1